MEQKPRIVFMGTPEFAVESLKKLVENNYRVVGVITAPDKPAGRGKKLRESAVKKYAKKHNLPVLQPANLKDENFLNQLAELKPDLQVVVAFRMLPKVVWNLSPMGTFNLHASLLPDYRGAAPINWALINGETESGVTTFFIDDQIDTGAIILQEKIPVSITDNASSLHDKLMNLGSDLVLKTVDLIAKNEVKPIVQSKKENLKKAPKLNAENTHINWHKSAKDIYNHIRGLSQYPGAWTYLKIGDDDPKKWFIYKSRFEEVDHNDEIGSLLKGKKQIKIAVKDGYIYPEIVKLQGKKQMDIISFLNGLRAKEIELMF